MNVDFVTPGERIPYDILLRWDLLLGILGCLAMDNAGPGGGSYPSGME